MLLEVRRGRHKQEMDEELRWGGGSRRRNRGERQDGEGKKNIRPHDQLLVYIPLSVVTAGFSSLSEALKICGGFHTFASGPLVRLHHHNIGSQIETRN